MTLTDAPAQLQTHVDAFSKEIASFLSGKKVSAARARKHLQDIKSLAHTLRGAILASTKIEKNEPAPETVAAATLVSMAEFPQGTVELANSPTIPETLPTATLQDPPKAKRIRTAKVKKDAL